MAAQAGIEPTFAFLQAAVKTLSCKSGVGGYAQRCAQEFGDLARVVAAWPGLAAEVRGAILVLTRASAAGAGSVSQA